MTLRAPITCLALTVCAITVVGAVRQARQLDALRGEERRRQEQLKKALREVPAHPQPISEYAPRPPSSELLRLRSEVSQLARRERELAGVAAENQRLRAQIASARTNAAKALPPGYIRQSEARNLGYTSPEATLETILWAIRNRDFTNFLNSFTPEMAEKFRANVERDNRSPEEFFKEAEAFVGFNVVERVEESNGVTALKVGLLPNGDVPPEPMRFRLLNGEWKADSR